MYEWIKFIPTTFFWILLIISTVAYFVREKSNWSRFKQIFSFKRLAFSIVGFRLLYSVLLTFLQYKTWAGGGLGTFFLKQSLDKSIPIWIVHNFSWIFNSKHGYFIFYSIQHFWVSATLSIFVAWLFYRFLMILKRYKERFFDEGEVELGFLCALVVGWPAFIIFVPMAFLFVVIVSIFRLAAFKEAYTTLGWPFILSAFMTLIFASTILNITGLSVLSI
ncbi:MAG: hypothetical protein NTZ36_00085 [Candidatus Jorgensenbacteria bacterium]|nr:hypothetical protein [Candidatus Jorgensenbacteria bacterium]